MGYEMLKVSNQRFWTTGSCRQLHTQAVPPTMGTALGPVNYGARTPVPKDWSIVGWVIEMAC